MFELKNFVCSMLKCVGLLLIICMSGSVLMCVVCVCSCFGGRLVF